MLHRPLPAGLEPVLNRRGSETRSPHTEATLGESPAMKPTFIGKKFENEKNKNKKANQLFKNICCCTKESTCNAGDPGSIPGSGNSSGEGKGYSLQNSWASLVAQLVKNLPVIRETWVRSLTPVFWRREFHGLYSPRNCRTVYGIAESSSTDRLSLPFLSLPFLLLLHWVLVAAHKLSLLVAGGGCSPLAVPAAHCAGVSPCGAQALEISGVSKCNRRARTQQSGSRA